MRNLKRALSLAMASVMLFGMMVVGTSAKGLDDFKDASEIVNQDAVAVTSYIGIFDGYEDGEFKPENVVTRAEMAVIISKILYGGDVNVDQFKDQKLFTDVPDWAEGYVNLCASLGIVAGYGDGKFGPSDTVTTAQAAMMLTKALGYFQNAKDYGDNWILAATAKATGLGIYGDLKLSATAGLNRDNVAEMVFNTLTKAVTVEYNDTFSMYYTTGSDWTAGVEFNYRQTLGYKQFKLVYESDDKDDFGRPCTIWGTGSLKADDIDADGDIDDGYDGIDAADEIISAPNDSKATFSAKITSKTLYNTLGSTAAKDYAWNIYVDGEELDESDIKSIKSSVLNNKSENDTEFAAMAKEEQLTGNGVLTEIYTDSDDKTVDIIVINTYVAEVLKAEDDYITLSALSGDADTSDEFEVTGYDEDDIVLYTYADGDIQSVAPATKLEGEVDRVRMNTSNGGYEGDNDSFTVDGTVYKYTFKQGFEGTKLTSDNVDNDVVAYLDAYGYVIYVDESASTYDYAYVLTVGREAGKYDSNDSKATAYARLILTDGTLVKAELEDNYATSVKLLNHLVSYTVDKDGVYTLTDKSEAAEEVTANTIVENGKASVKGLPGGNVVANSDTVFILVDSDDNDYDDYDISVYTGIKNVPDVDSDKNTIGTYATKADSTVAKVVYIQDGDVGGSGDVILAIANPGAKLNKGGDEGDYYEIDAVVDGAKTSLMVKGSSSAADKLVKNINAYTTIDETAANGSVLGTSKRVVALKSYTENSDGLITSVTLYDEAYEDEDGILVATGTLKAEDGTVGIGGTRYAYDDEVVVARYTVDDKGVRVSRTSAIKNDTNDIVLAVMDDSVVTGIFIIEKDGGDVSGEYTVSFTGANIASVDVKKGEDAVVKYTAPKGATVTVSKNATYDAEKGTITVENVQANTVVKVTVTADTYKLTTSAQHWNFVLKINGKDAKDSDTVTAGDVIEVTITAKEVGTGRNGRSIQVNKEFIDAKQVSEGGKDNVVAEKLEISDEIQYRSALKLAADGKLYSDKDCTEAVDEFKPADGEESMTVYYIETAGKAATLTMEYTVPVIDGDTVTLTVAEVK